MTESNTILDHFQDINRDFLHSNGEMGTEALISSLGITGSESVVEIGCGTGATLVKLIARFPKIKLTGMDVSDKMLLKASKRLKWCGYNTKVHLKPMRLATDIKSNSIDTIYIESVLAILDREDLNTIISFIYRILKKDGKLVINETIWLDQTKLEMIENLNTKAKMMFGIIQCNSSFHGVSGVINTLRDNDFEFIQVHETRAVLPPKKSIEYWSSIFTLAGGLKKWFSKKVRAKHEMYQKRIGAFFETESQVMDGYVFTFKKTTTDDDRKSKD